MADFPENCGTCFGLGHIEYGDQVFKCNACGGTGVAGPPGLIHPGEGEEYFFPKTTAGKGSVTLRVDENNNPSNMGIPFGGLFTRSAEPFEHAWSVLKAEFFIDGTGAPRGLFSGPYDSELYEGTPAHHSLGYMSTSERYSPLNMHYNTGREMASAGMRENFPNMSAAKVVSSPSREPFYRGGSTPRLNPDGSFTGANVKQILDLEDVDNFDQYAQKLGGVMGHEVVHELINPEIVEWAKQQSGITNLPPADAELAQRLENDAVFRAQMEEELGPYAVEEMLGEYDRQAAEHAFRHLKSMGHEMGAYALTPSMTQEEIYNMMQHYNFGPYIAQEDPYPMTDLHLVGPSADQLRYEQLLQEQGLVG